MHYKRVLWPKASSLTLLTYSNQYTKLHPEKQWGNEIYDFAQILPGKKGLVWSVNLKYFG